MYLYIYLFGDSNFVTSFHLLELRLCPIPLFMVGLLLDGLHVEVFCGLDHFVVWVGARDVRPR